MLPAKRKKVIFKCQPPILYTHRTQSGKTAAESSLNGGNWTNLPLLVLVRVFLHLHSPEDRRSVRLVCRGWKQGMNHPRLWVTSKIHLPTVCSLRFEQWSLIQERYVSKLCLGALSPSTLPRILRKVAHHLPHLLYLELELQKTRGRSYNLHNLSNFDNLRELTVRGNRISVTLPSLRTLKQLVLQDRLEVKFTTALHSLESLSMTVLKQNDNLQLENFPQLKSLCLTKSHLDGVKLTSDEAHVNLPGDIQHLDISYSRLNWGVRKFFTRFPNLRSLSIANCDFSERDLQIIVAVLKQLHDLNLSGNDTTDAVLMMLTAPLTALTLQRSAGVTARGLKQLSMYCGHTLVSLDLSYCTGISQQSLLTELKTWFPMITTLKLSGWSIAKKVVKQLQLNFGSITV